jgi:type IV pilus assembly protein PilQ
MTTNYQNNTQGTAGMLGENSVAIKRWSQMHYILSIFMLVFAVQLQAASLDSVDYSSLPDDKTRIILTFSESIEAPESFSIDDPARIVLDFAGITNKLDKKSQKINIGATQRVVAVEAGDKTRFVINLIKNVPYSIEHDLNKVVVTVDGGTIKKAGSEQTEITDIGFRRAENGAARLNIDLSSSDINANVYQERDTIVVELADVAIPATLQRRLDVVDFATPVQMVESVQKSSGTTLTLSAKGKFEHLAYQSENTLIVEVKEVLSTDTAEAEADEFGYSGEKLSLNFQNIEVRAILQLLADFTGMNLVTSDTVQGNLTLRLKNVPWDQALDIILKTKGLAMRQNGNVMLIAPAAEIAAREKQELEAKKQLIELEPLYSEIIEINFAKAADLMAIIAADGGDDGIGFLSDRGSAVIDDRTNSLLVKDTAKQLKEVKKLIEKLDIPVRQVLIESRIVIANNDFTKDLGVRFGASGNSGTAGLGFSGSSSDLSIGADGNTVTAKGDLSDSFNVDMPVTGGATLGLALAKLPFSSVLELELSAMQIEGQGEVISTPRVITSNQQTATIEQGTEIPYQEASSSGATSVSFKEALLKLEVTPQITPDDQIVMDLQVSKDAVGKEFAGVPSIDTNSVKTQVLVDNGETVVLGGVYEQDKISTVKRVPFFGDLPYVGFLFKNRSTKDNKSELLIFVIPKIIKDSLQF